MSDRTITIHAFCSVKGGVGKSALAVACAKLLAARGRTPALLDCALTGTSLADGLRLCAPQVPVLEGGVVDRLAEPTGLFFSVDESRGLRAIRDQRGSPERPLLPPYLNDLLNEDHEVLVDDLLPSMEYLGRNLAELPDRQLLVNRESQEVGLRSMRWGWNRGSHQSMSFRS